MAFRRIDTSLPDVILIAPDVFADARGYFMETYNRDALAALGLEAIFVQDNLSFSSRGILRGLHFQADPYAQGKLVSVLQGEVYDVAVDIRLGSPTFGKWHGEILSAENHRMMYVPPGFAHGFVVRSETCLFSYKCTNTYHKASEGGIRWDDPQLAIDWEVETPIVSDKDSELPFLQEFKSPFIFSSAHPSRS
jgi:dTDP-4-dehydrorhamnose 3,5-epimerase